MGFLPFPSEGKVKEEMGPGAGLRNREEEEKTSKEQTTEKSEAHYILVLTALLCRVQYCQYTAD
jgi:hypothetical protein